MNGLADGLLAAQAGDVFSDLLPQLELLPLLLNREPRGENRFGLRGERHDDPGTGEA